MIIAKSDKPDKRLKATFSDGKTIHFGAKNGTTYIDGATADQRKNWIARHRVRENWNDPRTAGALSRYLLWGDSRSLDKNHSRFMDRFSIR